MGNPKVILNYRVYNPYVLIRCLYSLLIYVYYFLPSLLYSVSFGALGPTTIGYHNAGPKGRGRTLTWSLYNK